MYHFVHQPHGIQQLLTYYLIKTLKKARVHLQPLYNRAERLPVFPTTSDQVGGDSDSRLEAGQGAQTQS